MVSEPKGQVAQDREDVGQVQYNGGVRTVRSDGPALYTAPGLYT